MLLGTQAPATAEDESAITKAAKQMASDAKKMGKQAGKAGKKVGKDIAKGSTEAAKSIKTETEDLLEGRHDKPAPSRKMVDRQGRT
jgi:hypothetical protein